MGFLTKLGMFVLIIALVYLFALPYFFPEFSTVDSIGWVSVAVGILLLIMGLTKKSNMPPYR